MATTTTSTENTPLHDYLVLGETLFVFGGVTAFLSDVLLAFRALVATHWVGLSVALASIAGTLYVLSWLYSGKREARQIGTIWTLVMAALAVCGVALIWSGRTPVAQTAGISSDLLGLFKAGSYAVFGFLLTQRTPALAYLRHRGGETVEAPTATSSLEDVKPAGVNVPLTAAETGTAGSLADNLQWAGIFLLLGGFFAAVVGGQTIPSAPRSGWLQLGEGVLLLLLGLTMLLPSRAVRNVAERGTDVNYVMESVSKLSGMFGKQTLLVLGLAAVTIAGIALRLGTRN